MVNVAVAGGTGELAREILDALIATKKHCVTILSRSGAPDTQSLPGVFWKTVDYNDKGGLVEALSGVHTVLSFINEAAVGWNLKESAQRGLIDACVEAGVMRFVPSEWGCADKSDLPFWAPKAEIARYLHSLNEHEKILEYTLPQPGLFLNYLAYPHKTTSHVTPLSTFISFSQCQAILVQDHDDAILTLTAVKDIVNITLAALDMGSGAWLVKGGICGNRMTVKEIVALGEKIRGKRFHAERVRLEDLEAGRLDTGFRLEERHPSFSGEGDEMEGVLKEVLRGMLVSSANGAWDVGEGLSAMVQGYHFVGAEEFLRGVWEGKGIEGMLELRKNGV